MSQDWKALIYKGHDYYDERLAPSFHNLLCELYKIKKPKKIRVVISGLKTRSLPMENYKNNICPSCFWRTLSYIAKDYIYCPRCGKKLKTIDMRKES